MVFILGVSMKRLVLLTIAMMSSAYAMEQTSQSNQTNVSNDSSLMELARSAISCEPVIPKGGQLIASKRKVAEIEEKHRQFLCVYGCGFSTQIRSILADHIVNNHVDLSELVRPKKVRDLIKKARMTVEAVMNNESQSNVVLDDRQPDIINWEIRKTCGAQKANRQ